MDTESETVKEVLTGVESTEEVIEDYGGKTTKEDDEFDAIVGALEEIVHGNEFQDTQGKFLNKNCFLFDSIEENKFEHSDCFNEYTTLIEDFLTEKLTQKFPDFNMGKFESSLVNRQNEIGHEIFSILSSLGDFMEFKEMMLSHKTSRQEEKTGDKVELEIIGQSISSKGIINDMADFSISGTGTGTNGSVKHEPIISSSSRNEKLSARNSNSKKGDENAVLAESNVNTEVSKDETKSDMNTITEESEQPPVVSE